MPNPHEPQKHQACFASNQKTLIFTETGNQSQRSPAATNLVFDFPPAATKQLVRSLRFFCYLALELGLFIRQKVVTGGETITTERMHAG